MQYSGLSIVLAIVILPFSGTFAMAQQPPSENAEVVLSAGLGAAYVPDYEGSDDYKVVPLPYIRLANFNGENSFVSFDGRRLTSNFIDHPRWRLGVTARYQFDYHDDDDNHYEEIDDERVSLLRDTVSSLQTGIVVGYDFSIDPGRQYLLEVEATYDVLHGRGGVITPRFQVTQPFLSQRLTLSTGLSATWANDEYMQNRFGVSAADAVRSGLNEYVAEGGARSVAAEASLTWLLDRHWALTAFSRYQRLTGDAGDSPIVEDRGDADNHVLGLLAVRRF